MAWLDNTGLYQEYGLEQVVPQVAGEYRMPGPQRLIELKLDLTALTTTAGTPIPGTTSVNFPAGFTVDRIEVEAITAATGATATLSLGLVRTDRTTEIDFDGLLVAAPLANMDTAGETVTYSKGVSGAGALVGTTVGSNPGYLVANWNTAAFTAGVVMIRIYYSKP
jgi:hypothetical protein